MSENSFITSELNKIIDKIEQKSELLQKCPINTQSNDPNVLKHAKDRVSMIQALSVAREGLMFRLKIIDA